MYKEDGQKYLTPQISQVFLSYKICFYKKSFYKCLQQNKHSNSARNKNVAWTIFKRFSAPTEYNAVVFVLTM